MALKSIFAALFVALLLSSFWRYRQSDLFQGWMPAPAAKAKPIVFDNGTVREMAPAVPSSAPLAAPVALHAMRKCQRGTEVLYTDSPCKTGFRELPITRGVVTVLDGQPNAKAVAGAQQGLPRATLHDVLDESGNANLRDKRIERAINR